MSIVVSHGYMTIITALVGEALHAKVAELQAEGSPILLNEEGTLAFVDFPLDGLEMLTENISDRTEFVVLCTRAQLGGNSEHAKRYFCAWDDEAGPSTMHTMTLSDFINHTGIRISKTP